MYNSIYKNLKNKLPLLLIFCLFNTFLPASASALCPTYTRNYKIADRYNRDGDMGSNGRAGRDGRSGTNQTISANGSPVNLDLSGQNGEDGEDGERGSRPRCREQNENPNNSINAPDGGNGGAGGKGGDGGNGGSLTVYYTNLADLQKILVRAAGGEGGRGGKGGRGTAGCNCNRRNWEVKTCQGTPGTPDYKCTNKVYQCYDGSDGRDGSYGQNGKLGRLGNLSIINSKEPLLDDAPTFKLAIAELANKEFNLSKNKWQQRQGATSLLAAGSVIADEYREFEKRIERSFQLIWQEKQPISNFANLIATLNLNDNEQIEVSFPEDLWVDGNAINKGKLIEFTVNYAIPKKDVTRLAVADFADAGQNLNLKIVDLAAKSDLINTQFRVKYRARDNFSEASNFQTFYEGEIPQEFVTRNYNRFTLDLGKLKIPSDALRPGVNVDIEVVAIRSLGGRSARQTLDWRGTIRKIK
jgi:hypothetical protein